MLFDNDLTKNCTFTDQKSGKMRYFPKINLSKNCDKNAKKCDYAKKCDKMRFAFFTPPPAWPPGPWAPNGTVPKWGPSWKKIFRPKGPKNMVWDQKNMFWAEKSFS